MLQAPHEATIYNSQPPRTLDCLYMRPLYTMHGGYQLYHIPNGKLITRHGKLHVIPTPQHVIDKINALGKKQNGSILKIESKYFPTWSAPVDEGNDEVLEYASNAEAWLAHMPALSTCHMHQLMHHCFLTDVIFPLFRSYNRPRSLVSQCIRNMLPIAQ